MNSRVIRPKTTCSVLFAKILSVFSIDAAYYKCQNFSFFQRACPPCPPPFWPIHLMAALSVWQYCGSALLIEQISRLRNTRKELECKSEVGRICGQGTKGANQFGRWRNWRFLSRHCCKSAFLSTSRFRLDTFSSGLPFKSASFADKFYAGHQFRSTGRFSTCPYSSWSVRGYVLYHMLCTSKSRVSYASMHVQLGRCEVFWTSNAKIWKFPLGLHKSLRSRHAALCFRRCADNLHSNQSFETRYRSLGIFVTTIFGSFVKEQIWRHLCLHREVNRTITILSQKQEQICFTKNAQFSENCVEIQFLAERILLVAETCSETTKRQFVQYVWYAAMKYKICLILVTHGIKLGIFFRIRLSCIYPLALGLSQVNEECIHFFRYFSEFDLFCSTKYKNFKSDFFLI